MHVTHLRRTAVLAALILWIGGATGCVFNRLQINDPELPEKAQQLVKGKTTAKEVEQLLGPATSITPIGNKLLYAYTYGDSKTGGLSLIFFNVSKTNTGIDTALILVDESEIVQDVYLGKNSADLPWEWWAFGD